MYERSTLTSKCVSFDDRNFHHMEISMEMFWGNANEKRHEQVGEGHFDSDSGSESGSHIGWWWRWVRGRASSSTGADVMGKP